MRTILFFSFLLCIAFDSSAQGFAFGVKGGLSVGLQAWNNGGQRDALIAYHGIGFIESAPEEDRFSVFAQLGYHVRGGAIRSNAFSYISNGQQVRVSARTQRYEFRNISLSLGGKQKYNFGSGNAKLYYLIGLRGDYTVNTNLSKLFDTNEFFRVYRLFYPSDGFVQKFNYGIIAGGGFEFPIADLIGVMVELTVNPDFSKQYRQPPFENVSSPYSTNAINLPSTELSNISLELTIGIRFINRYVYE